MRSLMRAAMIRYLNDSFCQLAMIGSAVLGCLAVLTSIVGTQLNFDSMWFIIILVLCSLLTALSVGREFQDGTIRNKLAVGHTKAHVFFAETVGSMLISVICYVLSATPFFLATGEYRSGMSAGEQMRIYFLLLCVYLVFTALTVSLDFVTGSRIAAVVGVLLVMGAMAALSDVQEEILRRSDPETRYITEYHITEEGEKPREVERLDYIDLSPVTRGTLIWLNHSNTHSSLGHFTGFFNRYAYFGGGPDGYKQQWERERREALNTAATDIPPQLVVIAFVPIFACMAFRKKDLK